MPHMQAAQLRQKYNLKEPEPPKEKKGAFTRAKSAPDEDRLASKPSGSGAANRGQSEAVTGVKPKKEKWYNRLFK